MDMGARGGVYALALAIDDAGSIYILGPNWDDEASKTTDTAHLWKASMVTNWAGTYLGAFQEVGDTGMGMDYLGLISYYLASPLNFLSILVPEKWLLEFFSLLMPVKLGLAGLFRGKAWGIFPTVALGCATRFAVHYFSGITIYKIIEPTAIEGLEGLGVFTNAHLYSLVYNGVYMLPETVFTVLGAFVLFRVPQMKKLLSQV